MMTKKTPLGGLLTLYFLAFLCLKHIISVLRIVQSMWYVLDYLNTNYVKKKSMMT